LSDHPSTALGTSLRNTRVVYSDLDNDVVELDTILCELLEENHYYPFGMSFDMNFDNEDTITLNRYRYNGKELQKELEVDWYNYGARFYDPAVGRWSSVDPLTKAAPDIYLVYTNCSARNVDTRSVEE